MRIARRLNAGFSDPPHDESPVGTAEGFAHTFPQSSLWDSKEDHKPHQTQASMPGLFSCRCYGTWNTAGYPVNGYRKRSERPIRHSPFALRYSPFAILPSDCRRRSTRTEWGNP